MPPSDLESVQPRVPTSPYYDRRRALLGCVVVLIGGGLLIAAILVNTRADSPTVRVMGEQLQDARANEAALRDEVARLRATVGDETVAIAPAVIDDADDADDGLAWDVSVAPGAAVYIEFAVYLDDGAPVVDGVGLGPRAASGRLRLRLDAVRERVHVDWMPDPSAPASAFEGAAQRFTYARDSAGTDLAPVLASGIRIVPGSIDDTGWLVLAAYTPSGNNVPQTQPALPLIPAFAIRVIAR